MEQLPKNKDIINAILLFNGMDHEWFVLNEIIDICGLNKENYRETNKSFEEFLTKDILERHYNEILNNIPADNEYHDHLKFMVFGALILLTNAKMPQDLKERILQTISWETELKWRWRAIDKEKQKEFLNEREQLIASFKKIIEDYPSNTT